MTADTTKARMRETLLAIADAPADSSDEDLDALRTRFREAFLLFGSETVDNLTCVDQIAPGRIEDGTSARRPVIGFRTTDGLLPLSTILNCAEGCPIPEQVVDDLPDLTQQQWDATLRLMTMLLLAFEGDPLVPPN